MDRPEPMTFRSSHVLELAEEHAARLGDSVIDPKHVLLGLAEEGKGVGAHVLSNFGASYEALRKVIGTGDVSPRLADEDRKIGFSSATERLLETAMDEATKLNHRYIGTEHLLLATSRVGDGAVLQAFASLSIVPALIRREVYDLLGHGEEDPER